MRTITVDIEDNFVQDFLAIIKPYNDKIQLHKDKNLEYDSYFYERQKQLAQDIEDIEDGKTQMLLEQQYDKEMTIFFNELTLKYAD